MKAIILAGGEGSRLRPLSLLTPKPMLPLFDRPLLEHLIDLLRRSGFTDLCITVRYLSRQIMDWFGDGRDFGVSIVYEQEAVPLGTAGGVKRCQAFIGTDDFLVIGGDAALDLDLPAFWEHHRLHGGLATMMLYRSEEPLEFGLVNTDTDNCVTSFLEKPGPSDICSDYINTGIYAFSPEILTRIPADTCYDFGTELFPALLRDGVRIHAFLGTGYWNDIGSCKAFRQTCRDVLDGKLVLPLLGQTVFPGKCWISPSAVVKPGAELLSYSVIGGRSVIEEGCRIDGSVLMGCTFSKDCYASDSIFGKSVHLENHVRVPGGCVLADGVTLPEGCILPSGSTIWPNKTISACGSQADAGASSSQLRFQADGRMEIGQMETAVMELAFRLGFCASGADKVGISCCGGTAAELVASAIENGCRLSGKTCISFDAEFPSAAALLSGFYGFPLTFFVHERRKKLTVYAYGHDGAPISRKMQRILERGDIDMLPLCRNAPRTRHYQDSMAVYYRLLGSETEWKDMQAATCDLSLASALTTVGVEVVPPADGILSVWLSDDGFHLFARDECGQDIQHTELLALWSMLAFRNGAPLIRVPYDASPVLDRIAAFYRGSVQRGSPLFPLGTKEAPGVFDGVSLLLSLLSFQKQSGKRLSELRQSLPAYYQKETVIETKANTGMILRALAARYRGQTGNGLTLNKGEVSARLTALTPHRLRLLLESEKAETASEFYQELAPFLLQ